MTSVRRWNVQKIDVRNRCATCLWFDFVFFFFLSVFSIFCSPSCEAKEFCRFFFFEILLFFARTRNGSETTTTTTTTAAQNEQRINESHSQIKHALIFIVDFLWLDSIPCEALHFFYHAALVRHRQFEAEPDKFHKSHLKYCRRPQLSVWMNDFIFFPE